jgi:sugar lactone lactonase YvrE
MRSPSLSSALAVTCLLALSCSAARPAPAPDAPLVAPPVAPGVAPATLARYRALLDEARDKPTGMAFFALAVYAARVGHPQEALDALARLDAMGWTSPPDDSAFPSLATNATYRAIVSRIAAREPIVHTSVPGFVVAERGLGAEGVAYDPATATFYLGSTTTGRIVAVDTAGHARDAARTGLHEVLGLKIGGPEHLLWAASNDDDRAGGDACVVAIAPTTGAVVRRACVTGPDHAMNDLAVTSGGVVYVTDSLSGAVLRLTPGSSRLETVVPAGVLRGSNGIVLAPGDLLLVAHARGIARIDLTTGAMSDVAHDPTSILASIDGMSLRDRTLYAVVGFGRTRIVRATFDADFRRAERVDVLETENPLWDEPTTGAIGPDGFYYIADSQIGSKAAPRETLVLRVAF